MKTLEELSDRLEIQDLITAYSYAIDFHRFDDLDAIFTPDATLDYTATGGQAGALPDMKTWLASVLVHFIAKRAPLSERVLVVGNLPYSVSKPILLALVTARDAIDEMALMLQREVAERVAATPGGKVYGSLSILTQLYFDVRLALRVPPGAFVPPPKVDSAVLHFRTLDGPRVELENERRFHAVVRAAFLQRRKMLGNALAAGLGADVETIRTALQAAGIDPTRRAETLTIQEFAMLASRL